MTYALLLLLVTLPSGAFGYWLCRRRCPGGASAQPVPDDTVEGLPGQPALLEALTRSLSLADRLQHPLTVLLIEIDGFARLQEQGLATEAQSLVSVWLQQRVRAHDLLGHWAPGQFLALLPDADVASALVLAEDMRQLVQRRGTAFQQVEGPALTVSIGVHGRTPSTEQPLRDLAPDMVVGALRALEATTSDGPNRIEIEP